MFNRGPEGRRILGLACLVWAAGGGWAAAEPSQLAQWVAHLEGIVPAAAAECGQAATADIDAAAEAIDQWAAQLLQMADARQPAQMRLVLGELLEAKRRVDRLLERTLEVRGELGGLAEAAARDGAIRGYLQTAARLIDLSGRLRYATVDGTRAALSAGTDPQHRGELVELLLEHASSAGAILTAPLLGEPTSSRGLKLRLLELMGRAGHEAVLPELARYMASEPSPELVVAAAETVRRIGLPQPPRPEPAEELPPPALSPDQLRRLLERVNASQLDGALAARHAELVEWARTRAREGVVEDSYRLGGIDVRAGDWLLMRNPSPYNLFTDLSPGLFTHVGVVTVEQGADGLRRFVVVDLPERGSRIPATNVETYVLRTLNYVFLRHPDGAVAGRMAAAARAIIGNESQFDLNFRTDRVLALAGQNLQRRKVHTYCAGLLLLCALDTGVPAAEFFPIREAVAGGNTAANLATLGLSVGEDFISPTGALFSPRLMIAGRREPMYDPRREVEEAIFDHFARRLADSTLVESPDFVQALRLRLAEMSQTNPLLAQALAAAANVNSQMDLVSAAKAAAVVETLDEIAMGRSADFLNAREALVAGPLEALVREGFGREELEAVRQFRQRHAELYGRLGQRRVSPRQLRMELVRYYIEAGKVDLDRRFFGRADR